MPVAYVVARNPAAPPDEEAVKRFFLERGAPYAHPRRVFFLDRLPLGGTGKLDRFALKRQAATSAPDRIPAVTPAMTQGARMTPRRARHGSRR